MTNATSDAIKLFVESNNNPTLADLIEADWPKLEKVSYLLTRLTGNSPTQNLNASTGEVDFVDASGQKLLRVFRSIPNQSSVIGELAIQLQAILIAIRIHEVESYDWVNLPPNMRERNIGNALSKSGVSMDQYRRALSLWTY